MIRRRTIMRSVSMERKRLKSTALDLYIQDINEFENGLKSENLSPSTAKNYVGYLKLFCSWCILYQDSILLSNITIEKIRDYISYLQDILKLRPNTINCYLAAVRKMFQYVRKETLTKYVLPDLVVDIYIPRVPSAEQTGRMLSSCNDLLSLILYVLLISTGLRFSEAISLQFKHIHAEQRQIHIVNTKGRMDRMVPLIPEMIQLLTDRCREYNRIHPSRKLTPEDYIFFCPETGQCMTKSQLRRIFMDVQRSAGLSDEHFTCHSMRHYFALQYYLQSHDILLIKRLLGHKSLAATEVYLVLAASIEVQDKYTNPVDIARGRGSESSHS